MLQVTGSNAGLWGGELNNFAITYLDQMLGSTQALTLGTGTLAITQTQSQNLAFVLSGALSGDCILTLPFNIATGATTAVGGVFEFDNQTTNAHTVTVKTVAAGSTGVTIPQGLRALLYSNGTNVKYANDGGKSLASSVLGYAGNPNGVVTCTPASATTPADMLWDYTDSVLYICAGAPNTWVQAIPAAVTSIPTPASGYLTLSSNATNPILTNDSVAATTLYYTPYAGDIIGIPNGSTFSTYVFAQLTLALDTSLQATNGIYDVFGFVNSGNAAIGFGPSWAVGGGSVTAGSCARGTGAGSTQLSRLLGTLVNTVSITLNNGATTYSVGAMSAIYIGSVCVGSSAGQLTCHRTWGQSRRWDVWNAYNRLPLYLKAGDSTSQWSYLGAFRASDGSTANSLTIFSGLPEEIYDLQFQQRVDDTDTGTFAIGIGFNSTSTFTGTVGEASNSNIVDPVLNWTINARYLAPPSLGINTITSLEFRDTSSGTFNGTEEFMLLSAMWRG